MASITATPASRVKTRSARRAVTQLAAGMIVILGAIGFLAYQGLTNSLVYYITPSELLHKGTADVGVQLRLGGQVRPGSVTWQAGSHTLRFVIQDARSSVHVVSRSLPPDMFRGGAGAVVQGIFAGDIFRASGVLVKHSGTYVAPKNGQAPPSDNYANR